MEMSEPYEAKAYKDRVILTDDFEQINDRLNTLESALKQIEQISLEKMKSSEGKCDKCVDGAIQVQIQVIKNGELDTDIDVEPCSFCNGTGIIRDKTWQQVNEIATKALWPV